ncbi:hypothetical protein [Exiguobacterium sp. R-17]|uniref:hypothetical protein n=1 Tax=Exiguobacterium sp. R-17 TaxID=3404054 RepID=UPI003CFB4BA8
MLSTILAAYKELEDRVGLDTTGSQNKNNRIRRFIEGRHTVQERRRKEGLP